MQPLPFHQVKNEEDLKKYYDGEDVAWPTSWKDYAEKDTATGGYKLKSDVPTTVTEVGSKTTDASGIVQFGKETGEDGQKKVGCLWVLPCA